MHPTSRTVAVAVTAASLLALAVGGGVGYAAGSLPKNSVGSAQVKNGAIKGVDLKNNALTGAKVKDGSLVGADLGANSVTGAQVDESTLKMPDEPGSVTLVGTAFTPLQSSDGYGQAGLASRFRLTDGFLVASVPLPADVTATAVTFYVLDNGPGTATVRSNSVDAAGLGFLPSAEASSTGQAMAAQALTVTPAVLAGSMLELQVQLPAGGSYAILGARVSYQ
jgi:hypothetical protein